MEIKCKKKENINKLFIVICVGLLLLIVVVPVKKPTSEYNKADKKEDAKAYEIETAYYESRLKEILENTYGTGTMDVMIHMTSRTNETLFYSDETNQYMVDGVLVVAHVKESQAVSDITFAVCALFDLPAHKVAVLIKK